MKSFPSWVNFSEDEQSAFLNKVLRDLWPSAKTATENVYNADHLTCISFCKVATSSLAGIFVLYKPNFLSSMGFDVFDLGYDAPQITSVNVISWEDGNGVAIDLGLRIAGDNNVVLGIAAGKIKLSVRIKSLEVVGKLRIFIGPLLNDMSLIDAVSVSFIEPLHLRYKLQGSHILT